MRQPSVSIVIPTYSRPRQLQRCLEAIELVEYDQSSREIIVVDDGTEEDLQPVVKRFRQSLNLTLVRQSNQGPASARNNGVSCASGDIVAFTDDDCTPERTWLSELVKALDGDRSRMVGGLIANQLTKNRFSHASQLVTEFLYEYYAENHTEMRFFTSNNMACFADAFRESGGFCVEFFSNASEDRDFCNRWQLSGNSLQFARDAVVLHAHELGAISFWRQHFNYGHGAYVFHKLRAESNRGKLKIEPANFYFKLISSPFTKRTEDPLLLSSLIFMSQLANAGGFFSEWGKRRLGVARHGNGRSISALTS